MGNSKRLAETFGDKIRYCPQFHWLVYDEKKWNPDHGSQIQALAKEAVRKMYIEGANIADRMQRQAVIEHALKSESAPRIRAMVDLLASEPGISVPYNVFDSDPMSPNVQNGTIDLRNGELLPRSPTHYLTKISPVLYDRLTNRKLIKVVLRAEKGTHRSGSIWKILLDQESGGGYALNRSKTSFSSKRAGSYACLSRSLTVDAQRMYDS